jgi:hypothetical protein
MSKYPMKNLIDLFLLYEEKDNINKEFEIRFKPNYNKFFTKNDYDNLYSTLLSLGFKTIDSNGIDLLRIQSESKTYSSNSKTRTEIAGLSNIQKYCKSNQITDIDVLHINKTNLKDKSSGTDISPYDNTDFNFRASFQLEEEIKDETSIQTLKNEWANTKKTFRYMNRIELVHDTLPLVYHLSIVKSSRKLKGTNKYAFEYSVQKARVFENYESYEFEMELDYSKISKDDSLDQVETNVKKGIKYFYSALQDSNYPISYTEINTILLEYMNVIHGDKIHERHFKNSSLKIIPKDFIGFSSNTLLMKNIIPISDDIDIPNIRKEYTVTEKADGERRLMFISSKGKCYFIDTNMNVQYTGCKTRKDALYKTILDGEYIKYDKSRKLLLLYACFDIYFIGNVDKRGYKFVDKKTGKEGRLHLLEKVLKKLELEYETSNASSFLKIDKKTFYYSDNIFADCKKLLDKTTNELFDYNIDGLIFTPIEESIPITTTKTTWDYSFKWKPPIYNTIDFMVKINEGEEIIYSGESIKRYKQLVLHNGFNPKQHGYINPCASVLEGNFENKSDKTDNSYKPLPFYPSDPYDENAHKCNLELTMNGGIENIYTEENELIEDNTIVEFRYDISQNHLQKWIPLRVRHDKTRELRAGLPNYGNAYHVANNNWKSIHEPVTDHMLGTGKDIPDIILNDDDVYYNRGSKTNETRRLRDFHNLVVKRMLIKNVSQPGDTLIDYAVGKGGDFTKWIEANIQFVFGVDKSKDNIENWVDGACARYLTHRKTHKNTPSALFVPGNSSKNIRSGEAIYDEQYKKITQAIFGQGTKDPTKLGKEVINHYGRGIDGFDVSSCQFALHYFFESRETLQNFIQNVIDCTKVNGYFVGTSYDGKKIFNYLKDKKYNESVSFYNDHNKKKIWEITKLYENTDFNDDATSLGYTIDVYQESINKSFPEFLVNYEYFTSIMEKHGFALLTPTELKDLNLPSSLNSFESLFNQLNTEVKIGIRKKSEIGQSLNMNSLEKRISFLNNYFIYKKVRHDTVPVKLRGEYDDLRNDVQIKQIYDDDDDDDEDQELQKKKSMKVKKTAKRVIIKT